MSAVTGPMITGPRGAFRPLVIDLVGSIRTVGLETPAAVMPDDEIKAWLTDRYGDFVLYRPPVKSGTWLLWFGPFVLLIAAVAALLRYLHRRRARTDGAQVTAEEHRQAQALLAEDMRDEAP